MGMGAGRAGWKGATIGANRDGINSKTCKKIYWKKIYWKKIFWKIKDPKYLRVQNHRQSMALDRVAQWVGHHPEDWKVTSSDSSLATCLG